MKWLYLSIAGIFEIAWVVLLKYSDGFTKLLLTVSVIIASSLSLYFLSLAAKQMNISTAYSIWTGIGILGTTLYAIIFLKETINPIKLILIGILVLSVTGLKLLEK